MERNEKNWKPSDEQMKAINHAIQVFAQSPYINENDYLFNMFKGLKKDLEQLKALQTMGMILGRLRLLFGCCPICGGRLEETSKDIFRRTYKCTWCGKEYIED